MPEQWTGVIVGKMHNHQISRAELAEEAGLNVKYVSTVLNAEKSPRGTEMRLAEALDRLIAKREAQTSEPG